MRPREEADAALKEAHRATGIIGAMIATRSLRRHLFEEAADLLENAARRLRRALDP